MEQLRNRAEHLIVHSSSPTISLACVNACCKICTCTLAVVLYILWGIPCPHHSLPVQGAARILLGEQGVQMLLLFLQVASISGGPAERGDNESWCRGYVLIGSRRYTLQQYYYTFVILGTNRDKMSVKSHFRMLFGNASHNGSKCMLEIAKNL